MTRFVVYMEGGGGSSGLKALLRAGMEKFLRGLPGRALTHARIDVVPCGSRHKAYEAFALARRKPRAAATALLLVDAEMPIGSPTRKAHLMQNEPSWKDIVAVDESCVHLMTQTMEAWIVADRDALATYYGQGFKANCLPTRQELDEEPKADLERKLKDATRDTAKGSYYDKKVEHAADLLGDIRAKEVRKRCASARALFEKVRPT